ncbi:hypothetical protein HA451_08170 [Aeromonas veronii]|uniref:hypothetical protein n=1 Tax=Aeromonas TaxID=642 RepID=UPI001431C7AC|nr:hypothetical protein [Aeromonas veronii]NJI23021.1 hypothetical protein [Aeromonas veronii]NJI36334.1 hypothetical protein [Aeromonas veronii]
MYTHVAMLNANYRMIGLSADWVYQTWLIKGSTAQGIVIFENEDNDSYEVVDFHYEDEERIEKMLFAGSLENAVAFAAQL